MRQQVCYRNSGTINRGSTVTSTPDTQAQFCFKESQCDTIRVLCKSCLIAPQSITDRGVLPQLVSIVLNFHQTTLIRKNNGVASALMQRLCGAGYFEGMLKQHIQGVAG